MTTAATPPAGDDLSHRIAAAADGLLFSSESDRPFEPFVLPAARVTAWPPDARHFARMLGADAEEPAAEQGVDAFFRRHIELVEPADEAAWRILPRYDALKRLLQQELRELRVFRIGRVQVRCYVVGLDPAGNVVGLQTVAIET
jgi:hypothetical protein